MPRLLLVLMKLVLELGVGSVMMSMRLVDVVFLMVIAR
jgi:hypothetical protein